MHLALGAILSVSALLPRPLPDYTRYTTVHASSFKPGVAQSRRARLHIAVDAPAQVNPLHDQW